MRRQETERGKKQSEVRPWERGEAITLEGSRLRQEFAKEWPPPDQCRNMPKNAALCRWIWLQSARKDAFQPQAKLDLVAVLTGVTSCFARVAEDVCKYGVWIENVKGRWEPTLKSC